MWLNTVVVGVSQIEEVQVVVVVVVLVAVEGYTHRLIRTQTRWNPKEKRGKKTRFRLNIQKYAASINTSYNIKIIIITTNLSFQ